jgi:hypothetical protein
MLARSKEVTGTLELGDKGKEVTGTWELVGKGERSSWDQGICWQGAKK